MSSPERELAVFSVARALPGGERAAYLDQACAGDAELRRKVEELLEAAEQAGDFLQDPAPGTERPFDGSASAKAPPHPASSVEPDTPPPPRPGRRPG